MLSALDIWQDITAVRRQGPLVHCITNLVVMNLNANVLLAAGASPVMAHAHEEVVDMAAIAQAIVLNIGTLSPYWIESMQRVLKAQQGGSKPIVLDPVGAGATEYRNTCIRDLLAIRVPSVIRGNASEIVSIAGGQGQTRGVDSTAVDEDGFRLAEDLARQLGCVVGVSGPVDRVFASDGRWARIGNGHPWMTRITGVGCSESALIAAFCAVQPDTWRATTSAMVLMALAGQLAAATMIQRQLGVGSMQAALLDALQLMDEEALAEKLDLETGYKPQM
ncbi:MAG: hydroxyethylthiazole kinase [Rhodocyclales bacterium GT-UBC]|nr:MAG: hydroxyethylthiazole kinase [Rhodocyclales bacterium GT-UBC]